MKPKRYRLRYPAPLNSERWKCDWIDCAYGLGLGGRGVCPGEWWKEECPEFITCDDLEKKMKEAYEV